MSCAGSLLYCRVSGPGCEMQQVDSTVRPDQRTVNLAQVDTITEVTVTTRQEEEEAAAITEKGKFGYKPSTAEVERAAELAAAGLLTSDISYMRLCNADLSGVPAASLARLLSLCTNRLCLPSLSSEQWAEVERLNQNWRVKELGICRSTLDKRCMMLRSTSRHSGPP